MIKHIGNIQKSLQALKHHQNAVAFIYPRPQFGQGLLKNATITLKDLIATKEGTTQGSSQILANFKVCYDATIVSKIKKQGAAIIAKVHSDELGLGGDGQYSAYGPITNPLNAKRIIGGSSSGSAATFSQHLSFAIGTDTGDSVRLPASYNGFVGFKPSYGAISRYGIYQYASSLDTVAYFSHNVVDAITLSQVLFGQDSLDMTSKNVKIANPQIVKPRKIAILKDEKNVVPSYLKKALNKFVDVLKTKQIEVSYVTIPITLLEAIDTVYSIISFSEAVSNNSNLTGLFFGNQKQGCNWNQIMINTRTKGFGQMVQRRFSLGSYYLLNENQEKIFLHAQKVRRLIVDAFNQIYQEYDLLMFPATTIAPLIKQNKANNWFSSFLISANLAGVPSISLPFGIHQEMPFGLNLSSKIYSDHKLLSYSLYFEKLIKEQNDE